MTVADLHSELGLAFPGSPFNAEAPSVDILRIPITGAMQLSSPGGDKPSDLPPFADHSPLSGTGFVESASGFVPYWWMSPSPIPAGTTLWRVNADGSEEQLATYGHVALGWVGPTQQQQLRPTPVRFPEIVGTWATIRGERMLADILPDGSVVICSPTERSDMRASPRGLWWTTVARDQVDSLDVVRLHGTWRGRRVQVVGMEGAEGGPVAQMVYVGQDVHDAESLRLAKTDAGVYEAVVPVSELADLAETHTALP
ncbi:hypothetical protein [Demequina muriae]|uniref:Uncharacterized protein n=1 Tax=Demequina muriae TaxID=3051664 RepID=A0ABT8GFR4_9MICO|nr:hypothetical protein [Demequina sp. EGI L300058]MDN4480282.1 hypothetical protein [Demequina sp. EGI L300058]